MTRPLIQIDDEIREMNDEEYERYLRDLEENPPIVLDEPNPA